MPGEHTERYSAVFNVDKGDFTMVSQPGRYQAFPGRHSVSFKSVTTKALHAVRKGAGSAQNGMVRYENYGHVPSRFPGFVNVIDNVPGLQPGEQVPGPVPGCMMRPEQKSVALLRELLCRM